ncbi:Zn(II)2Cys6 transcription factor [Aspergillus saccharolyticus JOP 1030-1]|uniref:Zn(2)-C6 fungal-type domain-containing protein n=1 Tax=Aspergillus saccharolyticus JOP 1030-1 TaxID=1450539 RepID=A0A318Z5V4_9EURO|nr:hypothetical protein BP01DRAFT_368106 [Aspergillus saccharolyticus JOP 1030-1]PYH42489.1 hypothetical protein BP01DRAFT_368106 [Aspergillus saccharolyticus JOP 1030-1]
MTRSHKAPPKSRRVQCDKTKSRCQRCERAHRPCKGYAAASSQPQEVPFNRAITAYSIPFKVPGSQADRQLLHFYCGQAAESLASFSDPTLWTRIILQRCHIQPVIRNALVTLSALYQEYYHNIPPEGADAGTSTASQRQSSLRSLQLIARSHRQLRIHLSSPQASYEVVLLCGVLFYAFESLIG